MRINLQKLVNLVTKSLIIKQVITVQQNVQQITILIEEKMEYNQCPACGRMFDESLGTYCSYQCDFIASVTKKRFYGEKDLR